jgi:hypothetical protein
MDLESMPWQFVSPTTPNNDCPLYPPSNHRMRLAFATAHKHEYRNYKPSEWLLAVLPTHLHARRIAHAPEHSPYCPRSRTLDG